MIIPKATLIPCIALAFVILNASSAFAQRAFDCNSAEVKQQLLRAQAKHLKQRDPYPGVMGWWPALLDSVKMTFERRNNPSRTYTLSGKNYAIFLDRSVSQLAGIYVKPLDANTKATLGVTACTYVRSGRGGEFRPTTPDQLKLVESRKYNITASSAKDELGSGGRLIQGKHTSARDQYRIPYTVILLSPSYYTGSQRYKITYTVGKVF